MRKHRGEILEAVIRSSGYSLKALAEKLSISRNTLYNKFKEHDLSYEFILKVGDLIHYDFTYEYPEIKTTVSVDKNQHAAELWRLEQKYTRLLESYNRLLSFLVRAANDYRLEKVKHEIDHFLKRTP
ncbi:MAG: helix-turn-helix domain-containing protein [Bacteroidota bacterium]